MKALREDSAARHIVLVMLIALTAPALVLAAGNGESPGEIDDPYVVFWRAGQDIASQEEDHPQTVDLIERLGYGPVRPLVPWNGGADYAQRLNLAIASNEIPDVFLPVDGMEYDLAEEGALLELSELLPEYAPHIWEQVPRSVWDVVRASSPDGESIYYIPSVVTAVDYAAFIRTDWLERVGMSMPQTIEEYHDVLVAFRDQDANGNGDDSDELPTLGREDGRWMDHLFAPFGVAMVEGIPQWHEYDGELTYSAVTENMRDALEWISELYAEGLLDPETFLNDSRARRAKVQDDRAGSWFHMPRWVGSRIAAVREVNPEATVEVMPVLNASGYDSFYSKRTLGQPTWVFSAADREKAIAGLQILDWIVDPENAEYIAAGYEGVQYVVSDDGTRAPIDPISDAGVNPGLVNFFIVDREIYTAQISDSFGEGDPEVLSMWLDIVADAQAREIDGQGLPPSIYEGYPDLEANRLYYEYAARIIVGEWDISRFDEFVDRWYETGGNEVTQRARDFYALVSN